MTNTPKLLAGPRDLLRVVRDAIVQLQTQITWKPGKAVEHVRTRIRYGHLPSNATLADYETIIGAIVQDVGAQVYVYHWRQNIYPTVAGAFQGQTWLVMFGPGGVMETAFPPEDADQYLSDRRFQYLGVLGELLHE
ncbi:hypothetical protein [Candidatus Amarolinea aalborgensis]|uniref:hypothetical protein n=1 Tax=Candidatus Amarolinea aalborgensis TaxID=2249329 RepID=UPI003BF9D6D1